MSVGRSLLLYHPLLMAMAMAGRTLLGIMLTMKILSCIAPPSPPSWLSAVDPLVERSKPRTPGGVANCSRNNTEAAGCVGGAQRFLTIVACDTAHQAGLMNWLGQLERVAPGVLPTVVVLSMDPAVHSLLGRLGAVSVLVEKAEASPGRRRRDLVWLARMQLVSHVLDSGVDVLMSDIDAQWLRSPLPTIEAELAGGADIVRCLIAATIANSCLTRSLPLAQQSITAACVDIAARAPVAHTVSLASALVR